MGKLDRKVAVVTGAGRGQGRSHAIALAREGADVAICDIGHDLETVPYPLANADDLAETASLVRDQGRACIALEADVRDAAQIDALVQTTLTELGKVDVLVANAGVWARAPTAEISDALWREVVETNLYGVLHAIRAVSKPMMAQRSGRIIATASTAARKGLSSMAPYAASKWGVLGLVKSAAMDLGPYNITVNAICPGAVESGMTDNEAAYRLFCPEADSPGRAEAEEVARTSMHLLPVGWMPAQDITNLVVFLASDEARYISGAAVDISAGQCATWSA